MTVCVAVVPTQEFGTKQSVDFDKDVRPILSQHCFKCHGPDSGTVAAGLRLDTRDGPTKSGVVKPGSPQNSELIRRVRSQDSSEHMPPPEGGKPLLPAEIKILEAWISSGAKFSEHWSYVSPQMPSLPQVKNSNWCRNSIDRFVLSKLESSGLKPEEEADRPTLAFRASLTITGLPPNQALLDGFLKDKKPGAYERYVDSLLASPEYGEHQARYWLDSVRYGDTHGLQLDNERGVFPYRDWVVRAFNQDLPYNKFAQWQIAGDLFPNPTTEQLIATGYVRMNLTSGEGGAIPEEFLARNTFDRVDTTCTAFLGLTMQCARCHDHKFDPIKQKDYYGIYAFFNSTADEPLDGNITLPPPFIRASNPEQEKQIQALELRLNALRNSIQVSDVESILKTSTPVQISATSWQKSPVISRGSFDEAFDTDDKVSNWSPYELPVGEAIPQIIGKDFSSVYVRGVVISPKSAWVTLGLSSDDGIKVWLNGKLIHSNKVNRGIVQQIDLVRGHFVQGENELIIKVTNGQGIDGLIVRLKDESLSQIQNALKEYQIKGQASLLKTLQDATLRFGPPSVKQDEYLEVSQNKANLESMIPLSLIAKELPKPRETFVLKRGLYDQKGEKVERHVPSSFGQLPTGAPLNRLGFAQWLTSESNPLFARVFVNRIWQQHFGVGLVKTSEDFGNQGEWPVNPELLDYLAVNFKQSGWSVKQIHKLIVTSATFRQKSVVTKAKHDFDPENRFLSHGPRFRLDAEVIRDRALFAAGVLSSKQGGRGMKPYQPEGIWETTSDPASSTHFYVRDNGESIYKRSLYMFWKRTAPPPSLLTFDAPLRDTCTMRRPVTNTPLQALILENDPTFLEAARLMAYRVLQTSGDDRARLSRAILIAFGRSPRGREISILEKSLDSLRQKFSGDSESARALISVGDTPVSKLWAPKVQATWMTICSTLMNTDEFVTLY